MKKVFLLVTIFIFFSSFAFAEGQNKEVNWAKIENALYSKLKNETNKSDAEIYQAIGHALLKIDNQWERASLYFEKAVELNPSLYFSWYNLALINMDTEIGRKYFKKAIEANPDFAPPYYWIAYNYCRNSQDQKAVPFFKKYLKVAEGKPIEKGRMNVARNVLQEIISGKDGSELKKMRKPIVEK